jgi:DNA-binding SARP family transcriptional activator
MPAGRAVLRLDDRGKPDRRQRGVLRAAGGRRRAPAPQIPFLSNVTGTWITDERATIEFSVLGPLRIKRNGSPLVLRGQMQRRLLAVLLCSPGEPVSAAKLIDEQLVTAACAARSRAESDTAYGLYEEALALWRGEAYAGIDGVEIVNGEAERLAEQRLLAHEEHAAIGLDRGLHAELIGDLIAMAAKHPFREGLRAHLMIALYRSGRQAEALEVFRQTRAILMMN